MPDNKEKERKYIKWEDLNLIQKDTLNLHISLDRRIPKETIIKLLAELDQID